MRSQFLQSPGLSPYGRRGGVAASSAYAVNGFTPATVADYQAETYVVNGAAVPLSGVMTFARSGPAVAPGDDGYLDSFADGVIRAPSYALEDGAWVRGLTLETVARTNILAYSGIDHWTATTSVVIPGQTGVDGGATAFKLADDNGGGVAGVRVDRSLTGAATSTRHVFSWYARADQLHWIMAFINGFTTPPNTTCYFDVGAGVVGTTANGVTIGIQDAGNGWYRCWATFTTHATDTTGRLDLWLADSIGDFQTDRDGTSSIFIDRAQLETGALPSSHVATNGTSVLRNAESLSIASGKWPYSATAMSGVLIGAETFADEGVAGQVKLVDIRADANNRITLSIDTDGTRTGTLTLTVVNGGVSASVSAASELPPGMLSGFGLAWRVTGAEINIALDGVAAVAVANTAGVPDLSSTALVFGGMGFRKQALFWSADIGDAGLEEASAPGHFNLEVI